MSLVPRQVKRQVKLTVLPDERSATGGYHTTGRSRVGDQGRGGCSDLLRCDRYIQ